MQSRIFLCLFVLSPVIVSWAEPVPAIHLSPEAEVKLHEYNPEFSWKVPESVEAVRIQIAKDEIFESVIVEDILPSVLKRFVPSDNLAPGKYWWRLAVRQKGIQEWSGWTPGSGFSIENLPTTIIPIGSDFDFIRRTIRKAGNNTRILFEEGTYVIRPEDVGDGINYFIRLEDRNDIVIDGNGSTIVFDGRVTHCGFSWVGGREGCRNITIQNFKIVRNYPLALPLEVIDVDVETASFTCRRVSDRYPLPEEDDFQYKADSGWILDKDSMKIKFGTPLTLFIEPNASGPVGNGEWRYVLAMNRLPYIANLQPGDIFLKDEKYGAGAREFYAVRAQNFTLYNVDSSSTSINMTTFEKCNSIKIINCDFRRDAYIGLVSDGMHFKDLRGGAWIEKNTIEYNGDDGIAIHPAKRGLQRIDGSTIRVSDLDDVRVGDSLHFFARSNFNFVAEAEITAIDAHKGYLLLSLTEPVVAEGVTQYINYSLAGPQTMIRGNILEGVRGDGLHITLNGGVIEENRFIDIGERTMTLTPTEGGGSYSSDLIIRNNLINNASRSDPQGTFGAFLMLNNGSNGKPLHRNIQFLDNVCLGFQHCAVQIEEARDVTVAGNYFSSAPYNDLANTERPVLLVNDVEEVFFRDNVFREFRPREAAQISSFSRAPDWEANNPDLTEQFKTVPWSLDGIGQENEGAQIVFGGQPPARSLTRIHFAAKGDLYPGQNADRCSFANVPLDGDLVLQIKLEQFFQKESSSTPASAGLMIRESDQPEASMVFIGVEKTEEGYSVFQMSRGSAGEKSRLDGRHDLANLPVQLRLERNGDAIRGSFSIDSTTWKTLFVRNLSLAQSTLVGLAGASGSSDTLLYLKGDELICSEKRFY